MEQRLRAASAANKRLRAHNAEMLAEVRFWRCDALARLDMYLALHNATPEAEQANVSVRHIMPTLAALRDAAAKDWGEPSEYDVLGDEKLIICRARKVVGWKGGAK